MNDNINIISYLLKNNRVNNYTKMMIYLSKYTYYKDYYIPNRKLINALKINKNRVIVILHQLESDNVIKLYYIGKKRYFKFVELKDTKNNDIFHYDWLNDDE